jgi:hypothetical protein
VKKLLIFSVALLALAFAANSFAIQAEIPADTTAVVAKGKTQVTIGGDLRYRGIYQQNTGDFNSKLNDGVKPNDNWAGKNERLTYDYRYRLDIKAQVTPNTIGFIRLEGSGGATDDNGDVGQGEERGNGGTFRYGDQKASNVMISQAWMQHKGSGLLGIPAYIKVGHQPITVGAGIFYKHTQHGDDAIVAGITPVKGLDMSILTVKLQEWCESCADDQDLYGFMLSYAPNKDLKVGFDVSWLQSQHGADMGNGNAFDSESNLWNFGVNVKANVSGFKLYATGDFQTGSQDTRIFGGNELKYRGWAVTAGASYKFNPVNVGLDFGYGSGDKSRNNTQSTFLTSQANEVHYTFVYDYLTRNAAGQRTGGLQNTVFGKIFADADVLKNLKLAGSVTVLGAAKKSYGFGYAYDNGTLEGIRTSSGYIGTEIDATLTYQIDKGLKYFVEAGYLFAGDFWKNPCIVNNHGSSKVNDPWAVRHGIQLSF